MKSYDSCKMQFKEENVGEIVVQTCKNLQKEYKLHLPERHKRKTEIIQRFLCRGIFTTTQKAVDCIVSRCCNAVRILADFNVSTL